ncbi:Probable phenylalanine--tRNA ligase beta subunit [Strongyloides ratti]|uniref:Phenylalanine--tRNA ligase beta subunit n=1 Tax=Strongyloides ratti TaxID=34506 RepID=A0A090L3Z7_STRRB|nr:Probable phenylalanine--tRNA ligase beta subunit [Strongyloides ratti]CEF64541.1 Probable phenylalanine--tRNA ligase beta subunit [Strongyloides ratti]
MPTISLRKEFLDKALGKVYDNEEMSDLLDRFGLELDEIVRESVDELDENLLKTGNDVEVDIYKIDIPANRYDLLCHEGLVTALKMFLEKSERVVYKVIDTKNEKYKITVKEDFKGQSSIRPYVVGAVLKNVTLNDFIVKNLIDLQEKLHQNLCRRRTLVAIGTHDLDTLEGPFTYEFKKPEEIKFIPLNDTVSMTAPEMFAKFSVDSHLKEYLHILEGQDYYPVIYDKNRIICSLPPIINGDHSKITAKTKNIFIECTGTDFEKCQATVKTIAALFSEYCEKKNVTEMVYIDYTHTDSDKKIISTPDYKDLTVETCTQTINKKLGVNLNDDDVIKVLSKMGHTISKKKDGGLVVSAVATRTDVLAECDIIEDVGIGYGYDNIIRTNPKDVTYGLPLNMSAITERLRIVMSSMGYTEALTFALMSKDDISLLPGKFDESMVIISNPKTRDCQAVRTNLIAGLLKTLSNNKTVPMPIKLFEIQDVVVRDEDAETGAKNIRKIAGIYCNTTAGFEIARGVVDQLLISLNITTSSNGYKFVPGDNPIFFPDRCCQLVGPDNSIIGNIGCLHPLVLKQFSLGMPVCGFELTLEMLL